MGLPTVLDPAADFGLPYDDYSTAKNSRTDLTAGKFESLCIAVAALTHSAPRAWVVVSGAATAGTTGVMLVDHDAMWGSTNAVKPTVVRNSTGSVTVTWASSYADLNPTPDRQVTAAVSLRSAQVTPTTAALFSVTVSGNAATVVTRATSGVVANRKFHLAVY